MTDPVTVQPTDRDWGRLDVLVDEDPIALRDAAWRLATALAAAEHRIARLEAQSDIRGRAVVIYRERAREAEAERDCRRRENAELRDELVATQEYGAKLAHGKDEAEARIKAVEDVLDAEEARPRPIGGGYDTRTTVRIADIRRALESVPPPGQ